LRRHLCPIPTSRPALCCNDGGGKVVIRAPRVGNDGVGVVVNETSDHKVVVAGAREVDVEAAAVYDITANPFVDQALAVADAAAQAYMANASIIKSSLGSLSGIDNFHLMPAAAGSTRSATAT
jgi:filamentous hemagglutinin